MTQSVHTVEAEADYDAALVEIEQYFQTEPAPETEAAKRFNQLTLLIQAYEQKHWPIQV